jgi:hypothetical protein
MKTHTERSLPKYQPVTSARLCRSTTELGAAIPTHSTGMTREHPLGNTPQVQHPLGTIPRGGLAVVARAHKCSRNNELSMLQ